MWLLLRNFPPLTPLFHGANERRVVKYGYEPLATLLLELLGVLALVNMLDKGSSSILAGVYKTEVMVKSLVKNKVDIEGWPEKTTLSLAN